MTLEYACKVDPGVRPENDDRACVAGHLVEEGTVSGSAGSPLVAVVCDGCGGYSGGGFAARTVLEVLAQTDPVILGEPEILKDVLAEAARKVKIRQEEYPRFREMCTTIAGCVFLESRTVIFHAGDSRVYRFDGFGLARMTTDHSAVQALVEAGDLTSEQARLSPGRNIITRCIGVDCMPPDINVMNVPIEPGEIYLICSDGLWESMEHNLLKELMVENCGLEEKVKLLVTAALEHGADDNISVCLCGRPGASVKKKSRPFILD